MIVLFTGVSAIVPSILLVWFFKSRDMHPEPSGVLWATFWLGVLSTLPTLVVAVPVGLVLGAVFKDAPLLLGCSEAFFTAALPEELFKLSVLWLYIRQHKAFDEPMDGIVYGAVAALGFATFENLLYASAGLHVVILRAFTAIPLHACCGAIMGYYVGRAKFPAESHTPSRPWLKAYLLPVLIHGIYDAPLLWMNRLAGPDGTGLETVGAGTALGLVLGIAVTLLTLVVGGIGSLLLVGKLRAEQRKLAAEGKYEPVAVTDAVDGTPAPAPPAPPHGSAAVGGYLIALGFVLAGVGGLFLLGGLLALVTGEVSSEEVAGFFVGWAILAGPPLALGLGLFVLGLRKLPSPRQRHSPYRPGGFRGV